MSWIIQTSELAVCFYQFTSLRATTRSRPRCGRSARARQWRRLRAPVQAVRCVHPHSRCASRRLANPSGCRTRRRRRHPPREGAPGFASRTHGPVICGPTGGKSRKNLVKFCSGIGLHSVDGKCATTRSLGCSFFFFYSVWVPMKCFNIVASSEKLVSLIQLFQRWQLVYSVVLFEAVGIVA